MEDAIGELGGYDTAWAEETFLFVVVAAITPAQRRRQEDPQGSLASSLAELVSSGFSVRSCAKRIM